MTEPTIHTDTDACACFNEQAEKTRLLELLIEEKVSENTAASYGLLPEYLKKRQPRAA